MKNRKFKNKKFKNKKFRNKRFLSKIVSLGMALTLTCSMLPMQTLRAEEAAKNESQKAEGQESDAQGNGEVQEKEEIVQEVVEINTVDDFLAFADKCSLDSWSSDKLVLLNADIDLSGIEFDAIQVFTGTFDGQDHTISGFQYSGDGYVAGLFRYIEKDGLVENLVLNGEVIASDEKECIGGLCGVNYGTIRNCKFQGTVSGRTTVGGLVGVNEGTGSIQNSFAGGRVTGYYSTGGIAGKNHGIMSYCINRACINNDSEWVEEDDEMGVGIFLSINVSESETDLFSGVDTGGIAGYSDGMITRCTNYGKVGYEHTGYNIGGIAGRQSGVVSSCTNIGMVFGRKDVGGIVGQMEPYIEIDEATSLRNAVNRLHDLIEKTIDDMENGKNAVKSDLDDLAAYSDNAADAGDALAGQLTDFVDENMEQVQNMTDRLKHVMEMLPDVFDDVYKAEDSFSDANKTLMLVVEDLKDVGNIGGEYVETEYNRLTLLSTVGGNILSLQHYPEAGETVHIMAEPNVGYALNELKVIDANGNGIGIQQESERDYTFVMPEPNVRVEAYFAYQGTDSDEEEEDGEESSELPNDEIPNIKDNLSDIIDAVLGNGGNQSDKNGTGGNIENIGTNGETDASGGNADKTDVTAEASKDKTDGAAGSSEDKTGDAAGAADTAGDAAATSGGKTEDAADTTDGKMDNAADAAGGKADGEDSAENEDRVTDESNDGEEASSENQEVRIHRFAYTSKQLMSASDNILPEPNEMEERKERKDAVVQLSSNLSGNASCEVDGSTAVVTVIPDGGYTVSAAPSVTSAGGTVSVTRSGDGEYAYTFDVSDGGVYEVNIVFRKLDKSQTVNSAKDDINSAIKKQQAAAEKVNAMIQEIQSSSSATPEQLEELTKALEEMSNATSAVLSNLSVVSNIVGQHALDKLEDMGNDMTTALNHLQDAVDSIKSATRDARSIVDYVNGQPNLHFSKLGGAFDANREELHDQLKGMANSIKNLSNNASDYSDVINDDLRAVNNQINVIFNLLADNVINYADISMEELYEDIDIDDTASITTGKSDNCTNKGIIKGDINVGGIAGSMSIDEEDPEDSAAGSIDYQIGRRYFTKCIITGGVNEGHITAKKDGAGGIVGYMRHGIVVDSEGYGSVESTEGDYVGGICGESFTVIKRCYALCSVSGGKNVGGIAGFADTLKDCYAIADCNAAIGRKGAIAGQTVNYDDALNEEEIKVSGNYYVGDDLYGIDNISYIGIAEPISYEELLTKANLPTQFRHLKVAFRIEDLYLGEQEVKFGASLSELEYPTIPGKEGYYGVWPDYSDEIMTGNLLITGEYKEDVTVVQSNETQSLGTEGEREKPYALVEQHFTEDTVLRVNISDTTPPDNALDKEHVIYDIRLENAKITDADTFAIRLYNPYEDAVVWGYKGGTWTELESKARGQYLQVDMTGAEQSFCIIEHKSTAWVIIGCVAGGVIVVVLLIALLKKSKARHDERKAKVKETKDR